MTLAEARNNKPSLLRTTLGLFIHEERLLLAVKGRKIGKGILSGCGGKIEPGETSAESLISESQQEFGLTPLDFQMVAVLEIYNPDRPGWDISCDAYRITRWSGTLQMKEDEAYEPEWWPLDRLPENRMWPSDRPWVLRALRGERLRVAFVQDLSYSVLDMEITPVTRFT